MKAKVEKDNPDPQYRNGYRRAVITFDAPGSVDVEVVISGFGDAVPDMADRIAGLLNAESEVS